LQIPGPYTGTTLAYLGIGLIHQGIVMTAPLIHPQRPYTYLLALDTNLPLPHRAVESVQRFLALIGTPCDAPYSHAWNQSIPVEAWPNIAYKLRENLRNNSGASFSEQR
jgi:hypothetical protein